MAAHHRSPDRSPQEPRSGIEEPSHQDSIAASADGTTVSDGAPVAAAIEREELRARIRELERELRASERKRQDVVRQYERILADRDGADSSTESAETVRSRLERLLGHGY